MSRINQVRFFGNAVGTFNLPIDASRSFRLLAIYAQVTTSATVGTRSPRLVVGGPEGGSYVCWIPTGRTQAESLTYYWSWVPGVDFVDDSTMRLVQLPNMVFPPNSRPQMVWTGWDSGDSIDAGWLMVEYLD